MASKQTEELNALYRGWVAALQANPEMPLDELRHMFDKWDSITGEPGGVDYIETDAGGVPAMWPARCTRTARPMPTSQKRSAAARSLSITGARQRTSIPAR